MKVLVIIALVLQSIGLVLKLLFSVGNLVDADVDKDLVSYSKLSMLPTIFFEAVFIYLVCVL